MGRKTNFYYKNTPWALALILFLIGCSTENKKEENKNNYFKIKIENYCESKIQQIKLSENLLNDLDIENRKKLLYAANSHPIVFVKKPTKNTCSKLCAILEKSNPWSFVVKYGDYFRNNPQIGRDLFLHGGYFYSDNPKIAQVMGQIVSADMLFNSKHIWIQRGSVIIKAEKRKTGYYYTDGVFKNTKANIFLFDFIQETPIDITFGHIDPVQLRDSINAKIIKPTFITNEYIIADVVFDNFQNNVAVFKRNGVGGDFECTNTDYSFRPNYGLNNWKSSIIKTISIGSIFDEPKFEVGQQDGQLRDAWKSAFWRSRTNFEFNTVTYYVYNAQGIAAPPEVCIDFIKDSLDIAQGYWYSPRKYRYHPKKIGNDILNIPEWRTIDGFLEFANNKPQYFEVYDIKPVAFNSKNYIGWIESMSINGNIQTGDIVFIKGKVPWDPNKSHSHSFIILESDPITGIPISLAGNAGVSSIRPWKTEINRTPKRYIYKIVRPKKELLNIIKNNK